MSLNASCFISRQQLLLFYKLPISLEHFITIFFNVKMIILTKNMGNCDRYSMGDVLLEISCILTSTISLSVKIILKVTVQFYASVK